MRSALASDHPLGAVNAAPDGVRAGVSAARAAAVPVPGAEAVGRATAAGVGGNGRLLRAGRRREVSAAASEAARR
jgi:hypothetical protein